MKTYSSHYLLNPINQAFTTIILPQLSLTTVPSSTAKLGSYFSGLLSFDQSAAFDTVDHSLLKHLSHLVFVFVLLAFVLLYWHLSLPLWIFLTLECFRVSFLSHFLLSPFSQHMCPMALNNISKLMTARYIFLVHYFPMNSIVMYPSLYSNLKFNLSTI